MDMHTGIEDMTTVLEVMDTDTNMTILICI